MSNTKVVNLADLSLQSEGDPVDVNLEGDHYAKPAPPDDGKYRVKLSISDGEGGKWKKGKTRKSGEEYLACTLAAKIIQPGGRFDGRLSFDNFVSTLVRKDTGTSKISAIYRMLRNENPELPAMPPRLTRLEMAQMLENALAGEPMLGAELRWHAQYKTTKDGEDVYETIYRGQKRFPKVTDPATGEQKYSHLVEGPNGEEAVVSAEIVRLLPLKDLPQES